MADSTSGDLNGSLNDKKESTSIKPRVPSMEEQSSTFGKSAIVVLLLSLLVYVYRVCVFVSEVEDTLLPHFRAISSVFGSSRRWFRWMVDMGLDASQNRSLNSRQTLLKETPSLRPSRYVSRVKAAFSASENFPEACMVGLWSGHYSFGARLGTYTLPRLCVQKGMLWAAMNIIHYQKKGQTWWTLEA